MPAGPAGIGAVLVSFYGKVIRARFRSLSHNSSFAQAVFNDVATSTNSRISYEDHHEQLPSQSLELIRVLNLTFLNVALLPNLAVEERVPAAREALLGAAVHPGLQSKRMLRDLLGHHCPLRAVLRHRVLLRCVTTLQELETFEHCIVEAKLAHHPQLLRRPLGAECPGRVFAVGELEQPLRGDEV